MGVDRYEASVGRVSCCSRGRERPRCGFSVLGMGQRPQCGGYGEAWIGEVARAMKYAAACGLSERRRVHRAVRGVSGASEAGDSEPVAGLVAVGIA